MKLVTGVDEKIKNETFSKMFTTHPHLIFFCILCIKYLIKCLNHFSVHYHTSINYISPIKSFSVTLVLFYLVSHLSSFFSIAILWILVSYSHWFHTLDIHSIITTKFPSCLNSQIIRFIPWYFIQRFIWWIRGCSCLVQCISTRVWKYFCLLIQ